MGVLTKPITLLEIPLHQRSTSDYIETDKDKL